MFYASALCTVLLGFSAFFDKWSTYSQRPIFQGRPWINTSFLSNTVFKWAYFIILTAISLLLNKCSSNLSSANSAAVLKASDSTHNAKDSILQKGFVKELKAASDTNISTFTKALGEYKLTYDSGQKQIHALFDSSNKEIPNFDVFPLQTTEIKTGVDSVYFHWVQINGTCTISVSYKTYAAIDRNGILSAIPSNVESTTKHMAAYHVDTTTMRINNASNFSEKLYFLVYGHYGNTKITKPIDQIYVWEKSKNHVGGILVQHYSDSIELFMRNAFHLPRMK